MTDKYRLVHFLPDPFSGARMPIAALVNRGTAVVCSPAERLPGAECLGSSASAYAVRLILESLAGATAFDELPAEVGPQVVLGPVAAVPEDVEDAERWVREHVLPRQASEPRTRTRGETKLQTIGFRFFETWNVSSFVHKRFQPVEAWAPFMKEHPTPLEPVSHWAGGPQTDLMLMEPFLPERASEKSVLQRIYNRLAGYRVFLNRPGSPQTKTELVVYAPPGSGRRALNTLSAFEGLGATLVDADDPRQRERFLEQIRSTAERAAHQPNLPTPGIH